MIDFSFLTPNDTGYYQIVQSGFQVLPLTLHVGETLKFTVSHSYFTRNQSWSMRFWLSETPQGDSLSDALNPNWAWVAPLSKGQSFVLLDAALAYPQDASLLWSVSATPGPYSLNIHNMENKLNGFYLKVESNPPLH